MDELIFRFLLDSGYPRGAIVTDHTSDESGQDYHPTFLIVDPSTAETLAVIDLVESGTREDLSSQAFHAGRYAALPGNEGIQAFVIQVDQNNPLAQEQVGFYKLLPGKKIQKVPSYAFPDLDALRVERRLKAMNASVQADDPVREQAKSPEREFACDEKILHGFALGLFVVGVIDWGMTQSRGTSLFNLQQILLLLSAVGLVLFPIFAKYLRR